MGKAKNISPGSPSSSKPDVHGVWKTPVGWIHVFESDGRIHRLILGGHPRGSSIPHSRTPLPDFRKELEQYFSGKRTRFTSKIIFPRGTPFDRKVWRALTHIPYGETRTYGWVADQIGSPGAQRAVGRACGRNPLPILIPCHRVVRSSGALGGFTGGIGIKRRLLGLEQRSRIARLPALLHADSIAVRGDRTAAAER